MYLLWGYPKDSISWQKDSDLIIRKVLQCGCWDSVKWLIATTGFTRLIQHGGAGLETAGSQGWRYQSNAA
ncbi:MAG: DUF6922 domain-containing protein [Candidatus Kryptoniota bacterium]